MKSKELAVDRIAEHLRDGMSILFGGFMGNGTPKAIVQAIMDSGVKELTIIGNDTAFVDTGVGPLITHDRVRKVIATHIGLNPETGRRMMAAEMEVELVPQGTLIERIRCGGAGLGGFLTPTGVGTVVEDGKQKITIQGVEYLLEQALRADLAIVQAHKADRAGNLRYRLSARNFNPIVALAADKVIAETEHLVEVGEIDPDDVMTPGVLVDYIVCH
ncbi:acetate CoA-transferase subunit alpha [Pseudothauera nasutitermitis]|uniref:Acetate CoA-transferase subunit alpha n=1 Tax=Pseudothauera nasutitermitis TaxID=2565930 RepID=A0A4V3WAT9_9RHOO|nr:acetate CoA-transferase subunit alpha [Pseudothauera nasutitermitis]THF60583.1 acetate CoA-transferase subunit alpha [Pseudothauera nasutitermitis]